MPVLALAPPVPLDIIVPAALDPAVELVPAPIGCGSPLALSEHPTASANASAST
jgi:hypothetical protein